MSDVSSEAKTTVLSSPTNGSSRKTISRGKSSAGGRSPVHLPPIKNGCSSTKLSPFSHGKESETANQITIENQKLKNAKNYDKVKRLIISDRLQKDRSERQARRRHLSNHVVSRFYRPPEIILMEKQYDTKVDMWSAGCVFAEFLQVLHSDPNEENSSSDRILLPGKSCYPLSPVPQRRAQNSDDDGDTQLHISSKDQMKHICRVLGTPKSGDRSFITDQTAIDYMNVMCEKKHSNKLQSIFPKASHEVLSLVKGMLEFNPHYRISAAEALASPVFDSIRQD